MEVTGFIQRSISDQQGIVGFDFIASVSSNNGSMNFGLSGTNGFNFLFSNGRIYDPSNNFIGSYDSNIPVEISGSLGQSSYDYYLQGQLVGMNIPWPSGTYSSIYANTANVVGELDILINGTLPNYYFSQTGLYLASGATVTGNIINLNPNLRFRVFDIETVDSNAPFYVSSFTSGDISSSGNFYLVGTQNTVGQYLLPLLFVTNFGEIQVEMNISGNNFSNPNVYLQISPTDGIVKNFVPKEYQVYFGTSTNSTDMGVSLQYLSGITGNIYKFILTGNNITKPVSGLVTGISSIFNTINGIVSGLDPLTSIVETGIGTGTFMSAPIAATGFVSGNYVCTVSGLGSGQRIIPYLASGLAYCTVTGYVSILGGMFPCSAINVSGTGNNPIVGTGIIPNAFGQMTVYPTGHWPLSSPLDISQYSPSYLIVPKVFEGFLSTNYSLLALGYATGAFVTGVVDSTFSLNFEPGYYTFSKYYNGVVSGYSSDFSAFNPATCFQQAQLTTGILTGVFSWSGTLDCASLKTLPIILVNGFPTGVFDSTGHLIQPNNIVFIEPSGGYPFESSLLPLQFTNISRRGTTPSGKGFFKNIITDCLTDGIWRECFQSGTGGITTSTGAFYSPSQVFSKVVSNLYITGSGSSPLYGGPSNFPDSGVAYFTITGTQSKRVGLRGLSQIINQFDSLSMVEMFLYQENILIERFNVLDNSYQDLLQFANNPSYFDVGRLLLLSPGNYKVVTISVPLAQSFVAFTQPFFSGCENGGYIAFNVYRYGMPIGPASVDVSMYTDITARNGVDYIPVTGTLSWSHSDNSTKQFFVPVRDNASFNADSTFEITLTNVSGVNTTYGAQYYTTGIILDNDSAGLVTGYSTGVSGVITALYSIPPNMCYPPTFTGINSISGDNGLPWGPPSTSSSNCPCATGGTGLYSSLGGITGVVPLNGSGCYSNSWTYPVTSADSLWHPVGIGICEDGCSISAYIVDNCTPPLNCKSVILLPLSQYYGQLYTGGGTGASFKNKTIAPLTGNNEKVGGCDLSVVLWRACENQCLAAGTFTVVVSGNKLARPVT